MNTVGPSLQGLFPAATPRRQREGEPLPDNRHREFDENLRKASEHPARLPLRIKIITLLIWLFAVYGFICFIAAIFSAAHAGTCRHYSDGRDSVTACYDGNELTGYTVTSPDGKKRVFGSPNGGFERYPGEPQRPLYERRQR